MKKKLSLMGLLFILFLGFNLSAVGQEEPLASVIEEQYDYSYEACKYPVELMWSEVPGAEYYEIEISRKYIMYFKSFLASKHIMIFPNLDYKWRVIAYKSGRPITKYSPKFNLRVSAPGSFADCGLGGNPEVELNLDAQEESLVPEESLPTEPEAREEDYELDTSEEEDESDAFSEIKAPQIYSEEKLFNKSWITFGTGLNFIEIDQEVDQVASVTTDMVISPGVKVSGGYFINDNWALLGHYENTSLTLETQNPSLEQDSEATEFSLKALYLLGGQQSTTALRKAWYLTGGLSYATLPFFAVTAATVVPLVTDLSLIIAHIGVGYRHFLNPKIRLNYNAQLDYAVSGDSDVGDYSLNSGFIFDSQVEANYIFRPHWSFGIDAGLKYISLDYDFQNSGSIGNGTENLLYPRFGGSVTYEF